MPPGTEALDASSLARLARAKADRESIAWALMAEACAISGAGAAAFLPLQEAKGQACLLQWAPAFPAPDPEALQPLEGPWPLARARATASRAKAVLAGWERAASALASHPVSSAGRVLAVLRLYSAGSAGLVQEPPPELLDLAGRLMESELIRGALDRENRALRALAAQAAAPAPAADEATLAGQALHLAMDLGGFDRGVALLQEDGLLKACAAEGLDPLAHAALQACPLDPARSRSLVALARGGGLSPVHLQAHPGLGPCFGTELPRFRCQPLFEGEQLLGLLLLGDAGDGHKLDESPFDAVALLLADQASRSLRTSRLIAALDASRRRLEQTMATLVQAEQLAVIGRMAAAVAHQVRNPLSVIAATTEMMAERLDPGDPLRADLAVLALKVSDTEAIVRELMQLGRPLAPKLRRVGVEALLQSIAGFVGPKAAAAGVRVVVRAAGLPQAPWIDPDLLERCLLDLALNAVQVAPRGGRVELGCGPAADAGQVEAWVQDDGPGLGTGDRDQLFEPFVSRRAGGTGLGLYNVRRICHALGARITAGDSTQGPGARFSLFLHAGPLPPEPVHEIPKA